MFKLFDNNNSILCICDKCGYETDIRYEGLIQPVRTTLRFIGWRFQNNKMYCKECVKNEKYKEYLEK